MKKKSIRSFVGIAFLSLALSACSSMLPGMNSMGGGENNNGNNGDVTQQGASMLTGYGKPTIDMGRVGDVYLDLSTYELYVKDENGWRSTGSLKGQDGKDGQDGQDGRDGQDAQANDSGLVFYALGNNSYAVGMGTAQFLSQAITIPSTFEDLPVVAIAENGFKGSSLTSVTIPNSITSIGDHAFENCTNLQSLSLPTSVTSIGEKAFAGCTALKTVSLGNVKNIGNYAFGNCGNIQSITFPSNLRSIGEGAFYGCSRLATVTYQGTQNAWQNLFVGQYWYTGTKVKLISCTDGSFNINIYNEEVLSSLDYTYHLVGGYDNNNWVPNADNIMLATSVKDVYNLDQKLGTTLSQKDIENLYIRQINVGGKELNWQASTFYKNQKRDINGAYTVRVSRATYQADIDHYKENVYIPDKGNFGERCSAEALTSNIFIPSYQSELDEKGFNWNNDTVLNVRPGKYMFVMAKYVDTNAWSSTPKYGFGLIVIDGGDMITNDPFEEEVDPNAPAKTYSATYLNEDDTVFATFSANSLAELVNYNKNIPLKDSDETKDYAFLEWVIVKQDENNAVTLKPRFEACTRGLVFQNNTVYQYTGMTQDVEIPSKWQGKNITSISDRCFQGTDIKSVLIPDSITSIESQAFAACKKLTTIDIPDSVTSIGYRCFSNCTSLSKVTLSRNITSIENEMFNGCSRLKNVTIPNKVTYIGYNAFSNCSSLTSIVIPDTVKTIGSNAFYWCTNLTDIEFGSSLERIEGWAFYSCRSLKSIHIPNTVTYIGDNAFNDCGSLVIYLKSEYKPKAFEENWSGSSTVIMGFLENVTLDNGFTYALSKREDHKYARLVDFDTETVTAFETPTNINGYQLVGINKNLFKNNKIIETVILPNGITEIEKETFRGCASLVSVTIPDSVTSIGESAFYGCQNLVNIRMSSNISYIGSSAFDICNKLSCTEYEQARYFGNEVNPYLVLYRQNSNNNSTIHGSCRVLLNSSMSDRNSSVTSLIIPNSVVSLGYHSLAYSRYISWVVLGSGLKNIDHYAFYSWDSLKNVYYNGTEEQWLDVEVENDGNDSLMNARLHYYSEARPSGSGYYWHYVDGVPQAW